MNAHLDFLLSDVYAGVPLHPGHLADIRKSGLTDDTIRLQRIRTVPPSMINQLLGFEAPKDVRDAYLLPFAAPRGGWCDHVRMKVFPPITTDSGTIKYLQPRRSGVRIYFPVATLDAVLHSTEPLYVVEGEKKALSVAQLGLPAIGMCGVEGWHVKGSRELHPDLDDVGLRDRTVYVVPDSDWKINPAVGGALRRFGEALASHGAEGRLLLVPPGYKGIDDWLAATA